MDVVKLAKWKKDLITKAWGKCNKSISSLSKSKSSSSSSYSSNTTTRSPSFKHYLKKSFTISSTTTTSLSSLNINIDDQNPNNETKKKKKKKNKGTSQVAPHGCFSVYVGPERRRFVVRAEFANHPLFRMLLEDAESEYGYNSHGPISLPCGVDLFYKVLAEMESCDDHHDHDDGDEGGFVMRRSRPGCSLILCSPLHSHGYKGYKLLSPSRLLKVNNF